VREGRTEARILDNIKYRTTRASPRVFGPPNEEFEACLATGGGAHWTGLERDVHRASFQAPVTEHPSRSAEGHDLRVSRRVGLFLSLVARAGDDFAGASDHRSDGDLAPTSG
jgi:hypothetical protein